MGQGCETCRSRKVKCDGQVPTCKICRKSGRQCKWEGPDNTDQSTRPSFLNTTPPSPDNPSLALTHDFISTLYRHYITTLATWYDLNDSQRRFQDLVSLESLNNPLLFSAILAFSSIQLYRRSSDKEHLFTAEFYHLQSIQKLIVITDDLNSFHHDGATLAATCLLRSYEILAQNVTSQSHLLGSSSFLQDQQINLTTSDLFSAGFWNYLREDITVALIEKRRLKIDLEGIQIPYASRDDERANLISLFLGKAINICFGAPPATDQLRELETEVSRWKDSLPVSFDPILSQNQTDKVDSFPVLWLFHGWHIAALQYYHTLKVIFSLASLTSIHDSRSDPSSDNIFHRASHLLESTPSILDKIDYHVTQICALAISNDCDAARVNAFGPVAFCGPYLRNEQKRARLVDELRIWAERTGWPTESILQVLQSAWN
ncbi:hypothetical protein BGW36DRAFT_336426 [Talaromyces proteolyticus]|uniref:Zn(2)-C6 fungal-type domain-containing protein n=1 Tax=Talaromyces proteolyticus TaxID=1131652 RepID=A0AAD4KVL5_9EURO|nr:uncharacterized protein BGW36DRAFT_336426 [Talaromyces proteolyticus]KAH8702043.1 hypothetical protein BGW36DRAFT_336426 [Talaromyces proteolyticus]